MAAGLMLENLQASELLLPVALVNLLVLAGIAIAISKFGVKSASPAPDQDTLALRQECLELRQQLATANQEAIAAFRQSSFNQIQSLLTQYPSLIKLVESKPDLPAKNLVASLVGLDNLIQAWELEPIGQPWQQVSFDPQFHQPDSPGIQPGDLVYVRFVGYRHGSQILVPAKVSCSLPGGGR
ncbi:MAG: molecular chaperone GrpE [Pseudanabaenaceae cyanobacterium bins.68]|nr:molecular chaperone GrpE [Pseudanabaenaceae cyanobacterium bins.68]